MDSINIVVITAAFTVLFTVSKTNSSRQYDKWCVTSCQGVANGNYHYCGCCEHYVTCRQGRMKHMFCNTGEEWDDKMKQCRRGHSPSCMRPHESGDDLQETSSESTTPDSSIQTEGIQCTLQDVLYEIIPIIIAFGVAQIFTCISCTIWKTKCCGRYSTKKLETATQTHVSSYSTYEELEPHITGESGSSERYIVMPYATSSSVENDNTNSDLPPYDSLVNDGNPYLELHGYTYLQLQDDVTREKVSHVVAPLIVALCNEVKHDEEKFYMLRDKLGKMMEEMDGKEKSEGNQYVPLKNVSV